MRPSSQSECVTPSHQNAPPLVFLLLMAAFAVAFIAVLPKAILSAASLGSGGKSLAARTDTDPATPENKAVVAALVRASDLLQLGGPTNEAQAARLLDGLPHAPLMLSEGGNTDSSGKYTPFSPSLLVMRLGRQMEKAALRPGAEGGQNRRMQWIFRCRRLADALLIAPAPSLASLKTAHYLDTVAGRGEVALWQGLGNRAGVETATRQRDVLRRVWSEQILPLLNETTFPAAQSGFSQTDPVSSALISDADWASRVSLLVTLYEKARPFISEA